jgi:hypothetical protein
VTDSKIADASISASKLAAGVIPHRLLHLEMRVVIYMEHIRIQPLQQDQ